MRLAGSNAAPEFPAGLEWVNALRAVQLGELRGKLVLLDFWSFCCINCMHIIPELDRLERDFPDELVVVGVHSAKFDAEKDPAAVRKAMERYGIRHMVVNDCDMRIWEAYGVHAWPTLVLIDPAGNIVARASGEHIYEPFAQLIGALVTHWDGLGQLSRAPLGLAAPGRTATGSLLSFPGKLAADEDGGRLFISDSGHHRIVVTSLEGEVQLVIGSGVPGLADGPLASAQFNHPQGLCFDAAANVLYVADTQNHAIRRIDLAAGEVTTLAGDGSQAHGPQDGPGTGAGRLASPWDVCLHRGQLLIAMAGTHQLWRLDLATGELALVAGSGRENLVDGAPRLAALSQPSGLALLDGVLYVADTENSAVRAVAVSGDGVVSTVCGAGLFEFGDRDGALDMARLQHCIGIGAGRDAAGRPRLYVADSYNSKIKVIDLGAGTIATLCGTGERGLADSPAAVQFNEPNDVLWVGGQLYVADTNNHVLRVFDPATGATRTLKLQERQGSESSPAAVPATELSLEIPQREAVLTLRVDLPTGTKLNPAVPLALHFTAEGQTELQLGPAAYDGVEVRLPVMLCGDQATVIVQGPVYYCDRGDEGLCYVSEVFAQIRIAVSAAAPPAAVLRIVPRTRI